MGKSLGVAVLRLAVGETGSASEPAPIGGVAICAELVGKGFCGKASKLFGKRLSVTKPSLETAGACLNRGGGSVAFCGKLGQAGRGEIV